MLNSFIETENDSLNFILKFYNLLYTSFQRRNMPITSVKLLVSNIIIIILFYRLLDGKKLWFVENLYLFLD